MDPDVNLSARPDQGVSSGTREGWYSPASMTPTLEDETRQCRDRLARWMRWYMEAYPEEAPSQAALARKLGVTPSAVSQILSHGAVRRPRLIVLIACKRVFGFGLDALLYGEPPRLPERR
jgi:hypothetical protein